MSLAQKGLSHRSFGQSVEKEEDSLEVLPIGEGSLLIDEVKVRMTETIMLSDNKLF